MPSPPNKPAFRDAIKARLAKLSPSERTAAATRLIAHLQTDPAIATARTILAYGALPSEISLDPFITAALSAGKRIAIPLIDWGTKSMDPVEITNLADDLETGRYDIRVPRAGLTRVQPDQIEVILLPGLAFDRAGNRLGRGAGFYDRFISALHQGGHRPTLIGVCHDAQIVDRVPTEPHDHRVDRVITEQGPLDPV